MSTPTPRTDVAIDRVYGGSGTPDAVSRNPVTDLCRTLERELSRIGADFLTVQRASEAAIAELAEVTECNLSNCNKLNHAGDKIREQARENASLRAALEVIAGCVADGQGGVTLGSYEMGLVRAALAGKVQS